jgi:hypothetical protein
MCDTEECEIDHEGTTEIVCPHCGHEFGDSWEASDSGEDVCHCGGKFEYERDVIVEYTTKKI